MKKQLLCTSAIALGVAAAPAAAQEWNMDWGGFFNQHVAYTSVSGSYFDSIRANNPNGLGSDFDFDGVGLHTNAEIIFTPSVTLDNGLTFGINVQFEATNSGTNAALIDESYMTISSDTFGQLDVGYENSAGYKMMVGAPEVTSMFINSPSISTFIPLSSVLPFNFRQAGISSYTEVAGNNDVARITYYTPSFNGFTLGLSYAPTGAVNAGNRFPFATPSGSNNGLDAVLSDIFDIGVSYEQTFGTTDVYLAARWGTASAASRSAVTGLTLAPTAGGIPTRLSDPETWGIGGQVTFNGITVGASYAENDNGASTQQINAIGAAGDQSGWSFGVAYDAPGPWSFALSTYQGTFDGASAAGSTNVNVSPADQEYIAYKLGASRDLGPGVDWDLYVVFAEANDKGSFAPGAIGGDIDGTSIGTAINLSF